jgi:hypothetical protein
LISLSSQNRPCEAVHNSPEDETTQTACAAGPVTNHPLAVCDFSTLDVEQDILHMAEVAARC